MSRGTGPDHAVLSAYVRGVLDVVDRIPPGKVLTYGDVAEMQGAGSARSVGHALAIAGHEVAWWRVLRATGHPAPSSPREALVRLLAEGSVLLPGGDRVDLAACRWDGRSPG